MPESVAVVAAPAERQIMQDKDVLITSARFVCAGQTYAVANITSVRAEPPKRAAAIVLVVLGLICALMAVDRFFGVIMIAIGALAVFLAKAKLILITSGGEVRALQSNPEHIGRVVAGLNEAIIARSNVGR